MLKPFNLLLASLFITLAFSVPQPLDTQNFSLTLDMTSLSPYLTQLTDALSSSHVTVSDVMTDANRIRQTLCNSEAYAPLLNRSEVYGFCWEKGDTSVTYWYPQGTTTTHDANETGLYENRQLIVNSWYHTPEKEGPEAPNKGVRISFTDWDADFPNNYRHILIVQPTEGGNYTAIPIHSGGIMWYGNLLYVADTWGGFRIFDMEKIYEVATGNSNLSGKQADGKFYAFNYRYVMPQVGWLNNTDAPLRFSFVSLDRASTPHSLVMGEYADKKDTNWTSTKVVRFPLNSTTFLPLGGEGEKTYSNEAYNTDIWNMQGTAARDGKFWFGSSNGGNGPVGHYGYLRVWERGSSNVTTYNWAYGCEDLSYWKGTNGGEDLLWTLIEYPNWRVVLSAPVDSVSGERVMEEDDVRVILSKGFLV